MLCLLERFELAADKELQVKEGIHRDPHYILIKKKHVLFSVSQFSGLLSINIHFCLQGTASSRLSRDLNDDCERNW